MLSSRDGTIQKRPENNIKATQTPTNPKQAKRKELIK